MHHAYYTAASGQRELDHNDQEYIRPERFAYQVETGDLCDLCTIDCKKLVPTLDGIRVGHWYITDSNPERTRVP